MKKLLLALTIIALVAAASASVRAGNAGSGNVSTSVTGTAETGSVATVCEMGTFVAQSATVETQKPPAQPAENRDDEAENTCETTAAVNAAPQPITETPPETALLTNSNPYLDQSLFGKSKTENGVLYVYVPGFGWVEENLQPGVCTIAYDMYENGNKVGIMGDDDEVTGEYAVPKSTPECVYYTQEELEKGRPPMPTTSNKPVVPDDYIPQAFPAR